MNGTVPTSPHTKTCRPDRGGTQTSYQLFSSEHATTQRGPGGRDYLPSPLTAPQGRVEGRQTGLPPRAPALSRRVLTTEKLMRSLRAAPFGAARFCMGAGWDGAFAWEYTG